MRRPCARVAGYSPSIGLPVIMGKASDRMRELMEFGLEAHDKTIEWMKEGTPAGQVAQNYLQLFKDRGFGENFLYGPCHGLGMIEVEPPWMEETSEYPLTANMTFQVDTFVADKEFGLRWEHGAAIKGDTPELMGEDYMKIIELDV